MYIGLPVTMFDLAKNFFAILLKVSDGLWSISTVFSVWMGQRMHALIGKVAIVVLRAVNRNRVEEMEAQVELHKQQTELELMSSASKLRDHAKETGEWTEQHTFAINAIGEALINACEWEEDAVHGYLRNVVEAIPGLEYGVDEGDLI